MNLKKLLTIGALTMFSASIATGQGTAPTIVQGDYISNVFGNSNFIKNPNAKLNNANVTVSNATVTRSTATPLVATSEFLVTTSTSTGSATWSTRTFDGGMKGQNCEARFTYRGFSVGSTTAQILQGANVVAQLTLTASTDPRIASINFPCGDLSSATTFRLQQATASLTGTNEIGGIYVGLATNMANVAQAENVVQASKTSVQAFTSGVADNVIFNIETKDVYGEFDTTNGRFTAKRAGDYVIQSTILSDYYSWAAPNYSELQIRKNNGIVCRVFKQIQATQTINLDNQVTCTISLAVGDYVQTHWDQNRGTTNINTNSSYTYTNISRFPSSSELVVTPERQNVFAGFKAYGAVTNVVQTNSWTKLTVGVDWTSRDYFGKAKQEALTARDYSITIENMPVGSYYISTTGLFAAVANGSGASTKCIFGLADSATGGAQIASLQQTATGDATATQQENLLGTIGGIYKNTSVATRTFYIQAYRDAGTGECKAYSDIKLPLTMTVIPLDQPSNSALYVQGPVQAAATGAAIPSGYAGQVIHAIQSTNQTMASNAFTEISGLSATLTTGIWMVQGTAYWNRNGAAMSAFEIACALGGSSADVNANYGATKFYRIRTAQEIATPSQIIASSTSIRPFYVRSDGTNLYFADGTTFISGSQTIKMVCYTGTWTGGPLQASGVIEAVRIN